MLAIRIELDASHGRRALGLSPTGAPEIDLITLAAALAEVRTRLVASLEAAYPGAKVTVALRLGRHGAGRTRVRQSTRAATWQRGEGARVLVAECAESLRDAAVAATAEDAARRRARSALDDLAAASDVRFQAAAMAAPAAREPLLPEARPA